MKNKNKFSLVIPTLNEEETIEDVLKSSINLTDDIFVVDGKSKDKTKEIVQRFKVPIYEDDGLGKGCAIKLAIDIAKYPVIVFMDADGSHDPEDINRLLEPIEKKDCDLVIGSRMLGGSDELFGTFSEFIRLLGSMIITLTINYRFNVRFTDYQNGFRAIKTEVAKKINLKSNSTTIEQEMAMKCLQFGYKVSEIPSHEYKRKAGISKINVLKVFHIYILNLLAGILVRRRKTGSINK